MTLYEKVVGILADRGIDKASVNFAFDDVVLVNNGEREFIAKWDEEKLGPRPTQEEIDAISDAAVEADQQAKADIRALEEASGFTRKQREFLKASVPAAADLDAHIAAKREALQK